MTKMRVIVTGSRSFPDEQAVWEALAWFVIEHCEDGDTLTVAHGACGDLPYRYRDVTQDDEAREIVQSLGYQSLPVVTAGDMHWSGYRNTKLKRLAEIHGITTDISWLDDDAESYLEGGVA